MSNKEIIIPAEQIKGDWIEKNIQRMMIEVMKDIRHGKPLPFSLTMHGIAYRKFSNILQSKSIFFPEADGSFKFIGIPVHLNNRLPYGSFTLERFKRGINQK